MPIYYLITSASPRAGKTSIMVGVGRALVEAGKRVIAIKPVETGTSATGIEKEDGALLALATGQVAPRLAILRFRAPGSPAAAARAEGTTIQFPQLIDTMKIIGRDADIVLLEGSGDPFGDLDGEHTTLDLARSLGAKAVLIVSGETGWNPVIPKLFAKKEVSLAAVVVSRSPGAGDLHLKLPDGAPVFERRGSAHDQDFFRTIARHLEKA